MVIYLTIICFFCFKRLVVCDVIGRGLVTEDNVTYGKSITTKYIAVERSNEKNERY